MVKIPVKKPEKEKSKNPSEGFSRILFLDNCPGPVAVWCQEFLNKDISMNVWNPPFWSAVLATVIAGGILALGNFLLKSIFKIDIKRYATKFLNYFNRTRKD